MSKEKDTKQKDMNQKTSDSTLEKDIKKEEINQDKSADEEIISFDTDGMVDTEKAPKEPIVDPITAELERVNAELDKVKNSSLRLAADFDNYKKRNADLSRKSYNDAIANVISDVLPIIDNFERALGLMVDEKDKEGVNLIYKQFNSVLDRYNVETIESVGCVFDPNFHNAVMQCEDADNKGKVVEELAKGYKIGNRVLRYAMVKVAN